MAAEYELWYDIKRKVIDVAIKEINQYSDIEVSYNAKKKGRSYSTIAFTIAMKEGFYNKIKTSRAINERLNKD